jgi:hypothetical protein
MPTPAKKSRSGGPKTPKGKAKSSMNAVSHGLTSTRVMPDEVQMVQEFTHELTEYYKPESPLEVLQIQRIAFCRAKLAKLIDIELAGREMARKEIELHPEMVMARLTQFSKFGLDTPTLTAIVQEIEGFAGVLEGEEDLPTAFPRLCAFLGGMVWAQDQIEDMGMDQRLMVFAQKIRNLRQNTKEGDQPETGIEALWRQIARDTQIEEMANRKVLRQKLPGNNGFHQAVDRDLQEIKALATGLAALPSVVKSFEEMKSWMLRSMDMNAEDAERMMKYQTMLERRLSTAIGELLELRKHR